jgi:hypothetical protein
VLYSPGTLIVMIAVLITGDCRSNWGSVLYFGVQKSYILSFVISVRMASCNCVMYVVLWKLFSPPSFPQSYQLHLKWNVSYWMFLHLAFYWFLKLPIDDKKSLSLCEAHIYCTVINKHRYVLIEAICLFFSQIPFSSLPNPPN